MTAFAATFVPAKLVADTQSDWLGDSAIEVLTGIVSTVEYYEGQTDEQLVDWVHSHERSMRILAQDRDWNEVENHRYEASIIDAILDYRAEQRDTELAKARYSFDGPLTHNPFAGLAA
jgi:hypothetical protein